MASLIQQQISTAAGEGAGSSSAHAAVPRSNPVVDTQNILDQFVPLVSEAHIGLVKHGDRMYIIFVHVSLSFSFHRTGNPDPNNAN
jgi:hypothetical protein